MTTRIQPDFLL